MTSLDTENQLEKIVTLCQTMVGIHKELLVSPAPTRGSRERHSYYRARLRVAEAELQRELEAFQDTSLDCSHHVTVLMQLLAEMIKVRRRDYLRQGVC